MKLDTKLSLMDLRDDPKQEPELVLLLDADAVEWLAGTLPPGDEVTKRLRAFLRAAAETGDNRIPVVTFPKDFL